MALQQQSLTNYMFLTMFREAASLALSRRHGQKSLESFQFCSFEARSDATKLAFAKFCIRPLGAQDVFCRTL